VEWSWPAWLVSVAAVVMSGAIAWAEGNWTRRPGLAMGFVNHGGMWGDLVLLSMANAAIVPHLTLGWWVAAALLVTTVASVWVHRHWYGRGSAKVLDSAVADGGDHMWPSAARRSWWRDLSWSGWAHVMYVIGELTLLIGFVLHALPDDVVMFVATIFTIHVPLGLLQPRWYRSGHIATVQEQPLLAPLLLALWTMTMIKM
jgi:hypothetical protein